MRSLLVLVAACGGNTVRESAVPTPVAPVAAVQHASWTPSPPANPIRPRLTLVGLLGVEDQITGDLPISRVEYRRLVPSLTFLGSGPRVYGFLDHEPALVIVGDKLVEQVHVLTAAITNDGGFQIGQPIDDGLAARLTRDRCTMGPNPLGGAPDIVCRLDGFELHVEGEFPVRSEGKWPSLVGRKIISVGVRLGPSAPAP